jgi:hypothetical protein
VRGETGGGEFEEVAVVVLRAEDLALVVAGKGGGIEDDAGEGAALLREAAEPVEGVAFAEVMRTGIEPVARYGTIG